MSEAGWLGLEDFPSTADERWNAEQNGSRPEQADSWQPLNLADLEDTPPVEPTLGDLGIVYPGKRHVFSGPQESAKTLAAYVIGLQVVGTGARIVLIDFEMGRWDAKTRLRELGASMDDLALISYVEPDTRATKDAIERLCDLEPELVIVDAAAGAYDLQELDDNKRGDVERFTSMYVNRFWRAGIATIVLDHVTKNAETRGSYAIGSERKVGGADVHLGFEVVHPIKRGAHGLYKIVTHKDRGGFLKRGKLAEFELQSDPETNAIAWAFRAPAEADDEHPFRPTVKMEQASKWLEKQLEQDVPMSHVEKGIGGDREAGRIAIQTLVDDGYFRETPGPRNARLMTLIRPYREEYDDLSATSPHLSGLVALHDLSGSPLPLQGTEQSGGVVSGTGELAESSTSPSLLDDDGIPF
jgi:hypothetical protein